MIPAISQKPVSWYYLYIILSSWFWEEKIKTRILLGCALSSCSVRETKEISQGFKHMYWCTVLSFIYLRKVRLEVMFVGDVIFHILLLFMLNINPVSCCVSVSGATVTIWAITRSALPTSERSWRTFFPTWRRAGSAWGANPNILLLKLSITILLNGQASVVAVHAPP